MSPPQIQMLGPHPHVTVFEGRSFEMCKGPEGETPMDRISVLLKCPVHIFGHVRKQ